jgi:hypothetical protein
MVLQESSPAFELKREPGHHYVMVLDRGPRECTCGGAHAHHTHSGSAPQQAGRLLPLHRDWRHC